MKIKFIKIVTIFLSIGLLFGCNEAEFLEEVPLDFFSPETALTNPAGFEAALTDLYAKERALYYGGSDVSYTLNFGTDQFVHGRFNDPSKEKISNYNVSLGPQFYPAEFYWDSNYKIISGANFIIENANLTNTTLTPAQKLRYVSEAKFFRAKAYRDLVYLYGGVPLITTLITVPKNDFVRATREEVLNQMAADFLDAATYLPVIGAVQDGKISNVVAYHYLAETYISLNRPNDAVTAASNVINAGGVSLMTTRFGRRTGVTGKDVYWDLFQKGNQNRASGNREALWVCQFQEDIPGGNLLTTERRGNVLERFHSPAVWSISIQAPAGRPLFLGRRSNDNIGGFGVNFLMATPWQIGQGAGNLWPAGYVGDMRCNDNNLKKDFICDNPASTFFGQPLSTVPRGANYGSTFATGSWRAHPYFVKVTTPDDHPSALIDPANPLLLTALAGSTYHDNYYLRLSETYLLRAEAYLAAGQTGLAAADINTVRSRAGAAAINAGDVTVDYILDERARELVLEEQRAVTLRRMGRFGPRVTQYNWQAGPTLAPKFDLFPIPQKDIDANIGAVLSQNPGY